MNYLKVVHGNNLIAINISSFDAWKSSIWYWLNKCDSFGYLYTLHTLFEEN